MTQVYTVMFCWHDRVNQKVMLSDGITMLAKYLAALLTTHSFCCPGLYWLGRCCSEHHYQKRPLDACSLVLVGVCGVTTVTETPQSRWGPQGPGVDGVSISHKCNWFLEVLVEA